MSEALPVLGYAAVLGVVAPRLVLRAAWPHRAPRLAVVVWHALAVAFTLSVALAAYHLATPTEHLHASFVGFLHSCGLGLDRGVDLGLGTGRPDPGVAKWLAGVLPAAVAGAVAVSVGVHALRARRVRARHRAVLDMVGRRSAALGATVVAHGTPVAYCLPGRRARVVVSEGALRLLSAAQVDAVLEHERAHVAGRHHLPQAAADGFAAVLRGLPLARHVRRQTALLLEMAADDRALRRHPGGVLATAMYEMAACRAPSGAFAVGGGTVPVRLRRVLGPRRRAHPVLRGAVAAVALTVPLVPLLVACPPALV